MALSLSPSTCPVFELQLRCLKCFSKQPRKMPLLQHQSVCFLHAHNEPAQTTGAGGLLSGQVAFLSPLLTYLSISIECQKDRTVSSQTLCVSEAQLSKTWHWHPFLHLDNTALVIFVFICKLQLGFYSNDYFPFEHMGF